MVTLLGNKGVFDNTTSEVIKASKEASAIPTQIINCYHNYLINRDCSSTLTVHF